MKRDLHQWADDLDNLRAEIWRRLKRGVHDRRASARYPTLATVSAKGLPQQRTVVLRAADEGAATLRVYTDLHSGKIADLRACPVAALHIWDNAAHLQMRLQARVSILTGPEVAHIWAQLPEAARLSYGSTPSPGTALANALAYEKHPSEAAFAVLHLELQDMDILHLGPQHRRARYQRSDSWQGHWCAP